MKFTPTLARGQEYYTGTVFEVYDLEENVKCSIGGGGRYDKIIGEFIGDGKEYPAVGISFGLDTIYEILKIKNEINNKRISVFIIPMNNKIESLKIAENLRKQNINVDIEMNNRKLKKSLDYANKDNIPFVIILGEDELKENKVIIKSMKTNSQITVDIEKVVEKFKIINKLEIDEKTGKVIEE